MGFLKLNLSFKVGALGGAVDALAGTMSGSGVRIADVGRGTRIFGAWTTIIDCGAGDASAATDGGRETGVGPEGYFCNRHDGSDNLIILDGRSELELSVLSGGSGRFGGFIGLIAASFVCSGAGGPTGCCARRTSFGSGLTRILFLLLNLITPFKMLA